MKATVKNLFKSQVNSCASNGSSQHNVAGLFIINAQEGLSL